LKKLKIRHRYFNFLVIIDRKKNTIIEKRTEKGIWQNLYQFPLIETKDSVGISKFEKEVSKHKLLEDSEFEFSLFNEKDIIHKLSHQHLHTKFWILEVDLIPKKGVSAKKLKDYPVPALISEFIDKFKF
jgi:A/G-specific adenine glycosylase